MDRHRCTRRPTGTTATRLICLLAIAGALSTPIAVSTQSDPRLPAFARGTLPATIPIFPLQDVMLFPHASRPFHIFEQRYRDMVADALEAHTPDALAWVLRALRELCTGRLTVVFGCGGDRDRKKRPLMGEAAAQWADRVFLTSDNPRSEAPEAIVEEIREGVKRVPGGEDRTIVRVDRREAIEAGLQEVRPGDMILIAGKGHERTQTVGRQVIPFDDRQVARDVLRQLGYDR